MPDKNIKAPAPVRGESLASRYHPVWSRRNETLDCPFTQAHDGNYSGRHPLTSAAPRPVQILTVPVRSTTGSLRQRQTLLFLFNAFRIMI